MHRITLDAEAGEVSAGLVRRGIAAHARVHIVLELLDDDEQPVATAALADALDWLAEEPDLYTDADLAVRERPNR